MPPLTEAAQVRGGFDSFVDELDGQLGSQLAHSADHSAVSQTVTDRSLSR
jgi:hypothetical protein